MKALIALVFASVAGMIGYMFITGPAERPEPRTMPMPKDASYPTPHRPEPVAQEPGPLNAEAGCSVDTVFVTNRSDQAWTNVTMKVNAGILSSGYSHRIDVFPAKETLRFPQGVFNKSDGTRLNLDTTACLTIDIHADTPEGRAHGNFGRR